MNPLYFGASKQALFGVYHPPRTREMRSRGVVLCYPIGQEYMRAHRAFRQLAMLLAKAGFPVLRFDYYGTGDSSGAGDQGTMEQWARDIDFAIDELKDSAAVDTVSLVGLRLGALLAAQAHSRRGDTTSSVLWDPVIDGARYFDEVRAVAAADDGVSEKPGDSRTPSLNPIGIYGFAWTPRLRTEIAQIRPDTYPSRPDGHYAILVSQDHPDYRKLRDHYGRMASLHYGCIRSPGDWAHIDAYGSALLPQDIIKGIVTYLSDEESA